MVQVTQNGWGPAVEFFPFAASPDGRWILYAHRDREEGGLMMVEHFR